MSLNGHKNSNKYFSVRQISSLEDTKEDFPAERKNDKKLNVDHQQQNILKKFKNKKKAIAPVPKKSKLSRLSAITRSNLFKKGTVKKMLLQQLPEESFKFSDVSSTPCEGPCDYLKEVNSSVRETPFNKLEKFIRSTETVEGVLSFSPEIILPKPINLNKINCRGVLSINGSTTSLSFQITEINTSYEENTESDYQAAAGEDLSNKANGVNSTSESRFRLTNNEVATLRKCVSPEAFENISNQLFSSNFEARIEAHREIGNWLKIYPHGLPLFIESSHSIISARIQDEMATRGISSLVEADIEALYSFTILRFVAVILEGKKKNKVPMRKIATNLGVNQKIVKHRNQIAHNKIPSMTELRRDVIYLEKFLEETFWKKGLNGCDEVTMKCKRKRRFHKNKVFKRPNVNYPPV